MRKKHRTSRKVSCHRLPGQKRRGQLQQRVKKVGPEKFAIVAVDCGKAEACVRVADFYAKILQEPFRLDVSRSGLLTACQRIHTALKQHGIRDLICVTETTGRYHRPIQQAFSNQGWETRQVHPFTSSLIRRSSDLGTKTDEIDLSAIHRAAVDGLAMDPEQLDETASQWRLLTRHRRDLVEKAASLKIQLKETIEAYLPGFTRQWRDFWDSPLPATMACEFGSPAELREASAEHFTEAARRVGSTIQSLTIKRLGGWAYQAAPADPASQMSHRRARSLWQDLMAKQDEIRLLELDLATFLCRSRYVRLMAFAGVAVVSASDYGAEMGPITNYANSKTIAGRAGLYPSRYQSAKTDLADGPLVARRNRQLRAALMRLGRNLRRCNAYFMALAGRYKARQPKYNPLVVIACHFSRLSYYVVAGEEPIRHPAMQGGERVLQKLLGFFLERKAQPAIARAALAQAIGQLKIDTVHEERSVLLELSKQCSGRRRTRGVMRLGEILPEVLLRIEERLQQEESASEPSHSMSETIEDRTHGL